MKNVNDIRNLFIEKYKKNDFVFDKTGVKTIELIGESFIADKNTIFGYVNVDYITKELEWYKSESLNVYDIPKTPKIWKQVCDKNGFINSNYGWCIYSKENFEQYKNCLRQLRMNSETRRAMMIYMRPSMQYDYNSNGMSDWICTNNVQVLIRNKKLHYIVNMRSNDVTFGYKNDYAWHNYVVNSLINDLSEDIQIDDFEIIWQVGSLHIYERDFKFIENIISQEN
jgi:thymidylate synthase